MNVSLTDHAVERYIERVRPGLGYPAAKADLLRLIEQHGVMVDRPDWYSPGRTTQADRFVQVAPGVLLPCMVMQAGRLRAMTVICHGHVSDAHRADRNARRRARKRARSSKARTGYLLPREGEAA